MKRAATQTMQMSFKGYECYYARTNCEGLSALVCSSLQCSQKATDFLVSLSL